MRRLRNSLINIRREFFAAIVIGGVVLSSICLGYSGGSGTAEEPYKIATKADLLALAETIDDYNKCFILTADINLAGCIFTTAVIARDVNNTNYDIFDGNFFTGVLDGTGHKISNLTIDTGEVVDGYLGLFGYVNGGEVKNLGIENFDVNGFSKPSWLVGSLVGYNAGNISNCYSTSTVRGSSSFWYVGGLVGYNTGNISDCYSTGAVSGGIYVGGLVGINNEGNISNCCTVVAVSGSNGSHTFGGLVGYNDDGSIRNCYSTGTVSSGYSSAFLGGLVGNNSGSIDRCYSTGSVSGSSGFGVGGLVGSNNESISNCYSTGVVSVGCNSNYVGGLAGSNFGGISNCYSTGVVSGCLVVGGLVGDSSGPISSCYFLTTSGPHNGSGTPLIDAQMKQRVSFVGWDFVGEVINGSDDIWDICEGTNYPKLSWQVPLLGDFVCPDGVEMNDLAVLCEEWLLEEIPADVWPEGGDGIVNFFDWAVFANQWQITADFNDLAGFAEQWLKAGISYCIADIAPDGGDRIVNMLDFAAFANNWLEGL